MAKALPLNLRASDGVSVDKDDSHGILAITKDLIAMCVCRICSDKSFRAASDVRTD